VKPAQPAWEGMETHGFGLGALLLALLVPGSAWLVAHAALPAREADEPRRIEFVRSAAGIQGRIHGLRELEKSMPAAAAQKSRFYGERREEARKRIDELARNAASLADGSEERAWLERLVALVRIADARHDQVLASTGEARATARLAMQK
jgi:hypothetical protein